MLGEHRITAGFKHYIERFAAFFCQIKLIHLIASFDRTTRLDLFFVAGEAAYCGLS